MAAPQGGLSASIRQKLQDGKTPEEIVKDLVAGGLGQSSAQRFVDRVLLEGAVAPPLAPPPQMAPDPAQAAPPADGIDQFIQSKAAETQAAEEQAGTKSLWVASILMCSGIVITAGSYIAADPGERYTLMWGPVVVGFLLWGKAILGGLSNGRSFAWFSAAASIALPIGLTVMALGVVAASGPAEEEEDTRAELVDTTPVIDVPTVDSENLMDVMRDYRIASNTSEKCALADALSKFRGEGRAWIASELANGVRASTSTYNVDWKVCTATAVMTLDAPTGVKLYEEWREGTDRRLRIPAEKALANQP